MDPQKCTFGKCHLFKKTTYLKKPLIFVSGLYVDVVGRFGLTISYPKTKSMVVGRDDSNGFPLTVKADHQGKLGPYAVIEHVASFNVMGSHV